MPERVRVAAHANGQYWPRDHGLSRHDSVPLRLQKALSALPKPADIQSWLRRTHTSAASLTRQPAIALAGGLGATVILPRGSAVLHLHVAATRLFGDPAPAGVQPAPNVASDAETASLDGVADALTTLTDPAVYGWWPSSFAELGGCCSS